MFEEFWKLYPRKIAKRAALLVWNRLSEEERQACFVAIPRHLKVWKDVDPQFIPHCRTWLYQGRWEDEIEIPEKKSSISIAWWTNEVDTLRHGESLGIRPRPGEDMQTYRARLRAAA